MNIISNGNVNLREFALHTTVILAQPRENQAPSGCRLRRFVGHGWGIRGRTGGSIVFYMGYRVRDPP